MPAAGRRREESRAAQGSLWNVSLVPPAGAAWEWIGRERRAAVSDWPDAGASPAPGGCGEARAGVCGGPELGERAAAKEAQVSIPGKAGARWSIAAA